MDTWNRPTAVRGGHGDWLEEGQMISQGHGQLCGDGLSGGGGRLSRGRQRGKSGDNQNSMKIYI